MRQRSAQPMKWAFVSATARVFGKKHEFLAAPYSYAVQKDIDERSI